MAAFLEAGGQTYDVELAGIGAGAPARGKGS
jgi:hypothetical protein